MMSIDTLNAWADPWADFLWAGLLDTTVILVVVAAVWTAIRRWMPAQLGYCPFLLVLIKLCVPRHVTEPGAAAYLSLRHAIERLSAWTMLSLKDASANRTSDGLKADDAMLEEMLEMMSEADGNGPETAASTPSPRLSLAAKLMCGWSATVLILLVWFAWAQVTLARVLRKATPLEPESLPVDLAELKQLAGVAQPVRLLPRENPRLCWGTGSV